MTWAWVNESSVRSRFVSAKESTLWHTLSSYRTRQAACKPAWFTRDYGYFVFWYIPQSEALLLTSRTQFYVGTVWFCACMAKPVRLSTLWKYCPISPGSYSPMSASALLFLQIRKRIRERYRYLHAYFEKPSAHQTWQNQFSVLFMCGFSPTPTQNLIQPKIRQSRTQKSTFKHNLGVNHSTLQGRYIFHQGGVTKRGFLQLIPLFDDLSCLKASRRLPETQQNRFKNIQRY